MEAGNEQVRELMSDIRAVDWLPLNTAVERLSRTHERAFLEAVGPLAINSHTRRLKAKAVAAKEPAVAAAVASKEQQAVAVPEPAPLAPSAMEPTPELVPLPAPETDEPVNTPS